jgi:GTP-binding protein
MSLYKLPNPQFVKTAIKPKDYPLLPTEKGDVRFEIAVIGRSNVGKSSLLNALFETKKLVKTSSVPGKTRGISFFTAGDFAFADLPGYGYAKVSKTEKEKWGPMIEAYLQKREELKLLLLLIDIRRGLMPDDEQMIDWLDHYNIPFEVVLTKSDKVSRNVQHATQKQVADALGRESREVILFSLTKKIGRKELMQALFTAAKKTV